MKHRQVRSVVGNLATVALVAVLPFASQAGDYTWLKWVESSGTQYVDTGIIGKSGLIVKAHITGATYGDVTFIGAQDNRTFSWGKGSVQVIPIAAGWSYGLCFKFGTSTYKTIQWGSVPDGIYEVVLKATSQTFKITNAETGDVIKEASYSTSVVNDTERNLYVFACNDTGEAKAYSKMKLHSLQLRQDDELVRDFYPAKRNSDGAVGLYDNVGKTFYQSGSADALIAGDEGGTGPVEHYYLTIAGEYATPTPAYGKYECTVGQSCEYSCPAVWTNDAQTVQAFCTRWAITNEVETLLSGDGNTASFTFETKYNNATFVWFHEVSNSVTVATVPATTNRVSWASPGEICSIAVPEMEGDATFGYWTGDGVTEENKKDNPISVTVNGPVSLKAVFFKGNSWMYDGTALCNAAGDRLVVTKSGTELTWTDTESLVSSRLDLDATILSTDYSTKYTLASIAKNCATNRTVLTDLILPSGLKTFDMLGFAGCSSLTNIVPFLPATLTSLPTLCGSVPVTNVLKLCSPSMKSIPYAYLPSDKLRITGLDMRGSGITSFSYWAFVNCSTLEDVIFADQVVMFGNVNQIFQGCSNVRALRFPGPIPTFDRTNPFACQKAFYYVPKWNAAWEAFLADPEMATLAEMDSTTWNNAVDSHAGEAMPSETVIFHDTALKTALTQKLGLAYWYPEPPPAYRTVSWFDVLGFDTNRFTVAEEADRVLVDGTTYTPHRTSSYYWYGAAGHEVVLTVPSEAATTRALKLTGYRLHQLPFGDWPNGRAPTAWKLYGQALDSDAWTLLDDVTMTEASANVWAYLTNDTYTVDAKAQTCPPRAACSLTYALSESVQGCYKAFKFVPSASYNSANVSDDETPIGLIELELLGEVTTPDPEIGSFSVATAKWNAIDFNVVVTGLGEIPSQGKSASSAEGWVEVYSDAARTVKVATSAKTALAAKTPAVVTVSGLSGNTTYYARLCVSNDLEGTAQADADCATLADPWVVSGLVCTPVAGKADRFTVSLSLDALYVDQVTLSLDVAASPSGTYASAADDVTRDAAGEVAFPEEVARQGTLTTVRVTATGGGETRTYFAAAASYWAVDDAASPTCVTHSINGMSFAVTGSAASGLTLKSLSGMPADGCVDLSAPFYSADGLTTFALKSVGTVFKNNFDLTEIILPESVVSLDAEAFNSCLMLEKVRISSVFETFGNSCFKDCAKLNDFEPRFPSTVTSFGGSCFSGCTLLPTFTLPEGLTEIGGSAFYKCTAIGEVTIPETVTSIGSEAFSECTSLTNVFPRFLPAQLTAAAKWHNCSVAGDLILDNPSIKSTAYLGFSGLWNITNVDMTGSSIVSNLDGHTFLSCTRLEKVTFPMTFRCFRDVNPLFQSCNNLREVFFRGPPPVFETNPFWTTGMMIRVPRKSAEWAAYVADHSEGGSGDLWVTPMTAAEKKAFKVKFPGHRCAGLWINLDGKTGKNYLCYDPEKTGLAIIVR